MEKGANGRRFIVYGLSFIVAELRSFLTKIDCMKFIMNIGLSETINDKR